MNQRDLFEAVCEYSSHSDRIRVGWHSRYYGERQFLELRPDWGREAADELRRFVDQLVRPTIVAHHEATRDARDAIHALMPIWERDIYRFMEHLERQGRRRNFDRVYIDEAFNITQAQMDALRYGLGAWWDAPKEDPKAKQKARELLIRNLDAGQEKSFKKDGTFRVTAKGGKVYTISTARSFNVKAEDGTKYCGQTVDTPVEDQMLAQKLLLEHDPDKFFKNANVSPAQGTQVQFENRLYMQRPGSINWL